jgi:hypothetical protein
MADQLSARAVGNLTAQDSHLELGNCPGYGITDQGNTGFILVAQGQVQYQISVASNAQLVQPCGKGRCDGFARRWLATVSQ